MSAAANLQYQDYQFQQVTPRGYWKWVTRMDLSGPAPVYSIRDIIGPLGLLRDSVPLPGPVVQSMAESITQLQSNFAPLILVSPSSLSFTLDEGRGFGPHQNILPSNGGVFGSLLDVTATSGAAFVLVRPASIGNLASGESGQMEVLVDSTGLLAANSPYTQAITLQDGTATNTPVVVPVTITVRPKATIATSLSALTFYVTRPLTGPYPPIPVQSFVLSNTGLTASVLDFEIQRLTGTSSGWLASFTPIRGTLVGGATQTVTVAVAPSLNCLPGTYTEVLRIGGYSTNAYTDVQVSLVIS